MTAVRVLAAMAAGAVLGWFARLFTANASDQLDAALYGIANTERWYDQ